jgi:hypothetical protein
MSLQFPVSRPGSRDAIRLASLVSSTHSTSKKECTHLQSAIAGLPALKPLPLLALPRGPVDFQATTPRPTTGWKPRPAWLCEVRS